MVLGYLVMVSHSNPRAKLAAWQSMVCHKPGFISWLGQYPSKFFSPMQSYWSSFFVSSCWPTRDHIGRSTGNSNPVMTSFAGGAKGCSDHKFCAPYTVQLLTLHQHRAIYQLICSRKISDRFYSDWIAKKFGWVGLHWETSPLGPVDAVPFYGQFQRGTTSNLTYCAVPIHRTTS